MIGPGLAPLRQPSNPIPAELQGPSTGAAGRAAANGTAYARPARSVVMRLRALREQGQVVDFAWEFADAAAARQLCGNPHALNGNGLIDVIACAAGDTALLDRYRTVLEQGEAQVFVHPHQVHGVQETVVHRVVRAGDGVTVTLTNLSADRRAQAQRLGIRAPKATARSQQA